MPSIHPYLTFNGNCEEAFDFYRSIFGGEFAFKGRFSEMPQDQFPVSDDEKNLIMHITLPISEHTLLMGSDSTEAFGPLPVAGSNFSISIDAGSREEADRLFNGLSAGGKVNMPMNETFWGSYFGNFVDKFGIQWMVSFEVTPMG